MPETKRFLETATEEDIELVRRMIREEGEKGRTYISRRLCEAWGWLTPKGKLRDMQCREVLRALERRSAEYFLCNFARPCIAQSHDYGVPCRK